MQVASGIVIIPYCLNFIQQIGFLGEKYIKSIYLTLSPNIFHGINISILEGQGKWLMLFSFAQSATLLSVWAGGSYPACMHAFIENFSGEVCC